MGCTSRVTHDNCCFLLCNSLTRGKGDILSLLVEEQLLAALQDGLRRRMPRALYEQWFSGTEIVSRDAGRLELGVKNRFFKSWIETRYMTVLRDAAAEAAGAPVEVSVAVSAGLYARFREAQEKDRAEAARLVPARLDAASVPEAPLRGARSATPPLEVNPEFTFANFVTGSSNRLSHAVALRAAEAPGEYGRLFFCGQHGVGKTHLLQAICSEVRRLRPSAVVRYVTCERFMADFIAAHAEGNLAAFRAGYRDCDLLAIDQVQILGQGNKSATQAELLGIIDQAETRGRQIVFASTLAPDELEGVDARLRDRLGAGFVDRLSLPDEETRRRLIAGKMAERGLRLPDEAVGMMARELTGNVRHLEGKVSRLAALMRIEGMEPTTSCIRMALDVSTPGAKRSALECPDIISAVAEEYGLTPEAVTGRGRTAALRRARLAAVVLCRKLLGMRYVDLGVAFGGRSHATIISMMKAVPAEAFSAGLEGRAVERILFRLGVTMKPEEILERQRGLFEARDF